MKRFLIGLVIAGSLAAATPAKAFQLHNYQNRNLCLAADPTYGYATIWWCGGVTQDWNFNPVRPNPGNFQIYDGASGMYLQAAGANLTSVNLGHAGPAWTQDPSAEDGNCFFIRYLGAANTSRVLGVAGVTSDQQSLGPGWVILWTKNTSNYHNQLWCY